MLLGHPISGLILFEHKYLLRIPVLQNYSVCVCVCVCMCVAVAVAVFDRNNWK
jgi:hypothetical protein